MNTEATKRYGYNYENGGGYTNKTNLFQVIVGLDAESAFTTAGDVMTVTTNSTAVDSIEMEAFGTAASEVFIVLPRKILVPPGATVATAHTAYMSVITCYDFGGKTSLENALAIL